jgi:hypothetical protein
VAYALFISEEVREQLRSLQRNFDGTSAIGYTFCSRSSPETLKSSKGRETIIGFASAATESYSAWTRISLRYMLLSRGRTLMSDPQEQELVSTVKHLAGELARLSERVEDLEDGRELDAAIRRNGDKPLIPWDQAKKELGLP